MPLDPWTLQWVVKPVTREEGLRILERDHFRCQYCGLDGTVSFENALAMGSGLRGTAGSQGPEESSQLGGLLSSVQLNKGAPHVWQFRNGESIRARTTRGAAQGVGSQETTS